MGKMQDDVFYSAVLDTWYLVVGISCFLAATTVCFRFDRHDHGRCSFGVEFKAPPRVSQRDSHYVPEYHIYTTFIPHLYHDNINVSRTYD